MSAKRLAALEAVAEAALFVERCVNAGVFDAQEGADAFDGMQAALRRLAALPAQPAGETVDVVEVLAWVRSNHNDSSIYMVEGSGSWDGSWRQKTPPGIRVVLTATVPLPRILAIAANVEPTP